MSSVRIRTQKSGIENDIQKRLPKRGNLNRSDLKEIRIKVNMTNLINIVKYDFAIKSSVYGMENVNYGKKFFGTQFA